MAECSFASTVTKFRLLGKAIERKVENAVHVVKAITLRHNIIRRFECLTDLDVQNFTAVRADPRACMPPSKRKKPSSIKAVFAGYKFCSFFKPCLLMRT
jgi:hypothetical protein